MSYRFRPTAAYSTSGSFWLILSVLAGIVLLAAPATAGLTTYLDQTSWSAAHGGVTILEDFESADINGDGDDDGGAEDLYFSGTSGPDTFNGLTFSRERLLLGQRFDRRGRRLRRGRPPTTGSSATGRPSTATLWST